jgi:hypothetical protein
MFLIDHLRGKVFVAQCQYGPFGQPARGVPRKLATLGLTPDVTRS